MKCRIIRRVQKGTKMLTTTHLFGKRMLLALSRVSCNDAAHKVADCRADVMLLDLVHGWDHMKQLKCIFLIGFEYP